MYNLQVNKALAYVDSMVRRLVDGLVARSLLSCVNLLLVADHGMVEAGQSKVIPLHHYIPNITKRTRFWDGTFGRISPNDGSQRKDL